MATLLGIPREVRDEIIALIVFSKKEPPENPSTAARDRVVLKDAGKKRRLHYAKSNVVYDGEQDVPASRSLALVNRQLSAETKEILARHPHSYSLDIMVVNELELWPTWLSVPALSNRIDNVVATFRVFGGDGGDKRRPGLFVRPDMGPPEMAFSLYSLMDRFLKNGPVAKLGTNLRDGDVTINTLTMDFVTPSNGTTFPPEDVSFRDWLEGRTDRWRWERDDGLGACTMRPEWLANFVRTQLRSLFSMGYHTASHGAVVYERIGTIRICVDGQLEQHIELDRKLADLRFYEPYHTFGHVVPQEERLPRFWSWKKQTLAKRRKAGLPVIDVEDPELKDAI